VSCCSFFELLKRKEWHIQIHLKVIKFVISVEKRATFETLVGWPSGGRGRTDRDSGGHNRGLGPGRDRGGSSCQQTHVRK
jgi:hypothetical protein